MDEEEKLGESSQGKSRIVNGGISSREQHKDQLKKLPPLPGQGVFTMFAIRSLLLLCVSHSSHFGRDV